MGYNKFSKNASVLSHPRQKPSLSLHCIQEMIPMSSPINYEKYESEISASKAGHYDHHDHNEKGTKECRKGQH